MKEGTNEKRAFTPDEMVVGLTPETNTKKQPTEAFFLHLMARCPDQSQIEVTSCESQVNISLNIDNEIISTIIIRNSL